MLQRRWSPDPVEPLIFYTRLRPFFQSGLRTLVFTYDTGCMVEAFTRVASDLALPRLQHLVLLGVGQGTKGMPPHALLDQLEAQLLRLSHVFIAQGTVIRLVPDTGAAAGQAPGVHEYVQMVEGLREQLWNGVSAAGSAGVSGQGAGRSGGRRRLDPSLLQLVLGVSSP